MNVHDDAAARTNQAIIALRDLGLPPAQQNERTALVLLSLLGMTPETPWAEATTPMLGITQMMAVFREQWGKDYAPKAPRSIFTPDGRGPVASDSMAPTFRNRSQRDHRARLLPLDE
ncbi:MAG: hypothetical protein ACYC90_13945 [Candidatus Nanopelagicales bacterium]